MSIKGYIKKVRKKLGIESDEDKKIDNLIDLLKQLKKQKKELEKKPKNKLSKDDKTILAILDLKIPKGEKLLKEKQKK